MIEGDYTETHSNSAIVDENSSQIEAKSSILAETNIETESTSQLDVTGTVLVDDNIEIQSKTSPNRTGEICENPTEMNAELNATVLNTKEIVYTIPASTNTSTILSLNETDALNSDDGQIVPAIGANNVKFETQSVSSTNGSGLLEGFINASQKDELSVKNIENTVLDRVNSDQIDDRGNENIDDQAMVTKPEDRVQEDLGDLPLWAAQLKGCERIGDSYRGYVHTEAELDMLLSMHKENTHSSWGTRQSPSSHKPSVRFMWKSQYVPYDGVPFLNSGRRATVMECQYGPRRKGNKVKVEYNEDGKPVKRAHRLTCPARIYIKRVRKFPEFKVDKCYEGTPGLRLAQERALTALRVACLESRGEERYYIQFPLETAHEYHNEDDEMIPHQAFSILPTQVNIGSSRLDPRVVEKINELVARGVTDTYQVKHGVIHFVEKDLFLGVDEPAPARHNKSFFPTVTDLQNHIHQAMLAVEAGTLESLPPPESPLKSFSKDERSSKRKCTEPRRVRAPKTPYRTICIRTDDPLDLQDTQGQVYVMLPSTSGLFTNPESLISTSLDGNKATSLVQVLTVPANSSSAFLGQQADGTLDLTAGQFLALPVVNCESQEHIQDSGIVVNDALGKEPISVTPAPMELNTLNKHHTIESETANEDVPMDVPTTVVTTIVSPTIPIAMHKLPSIITMATPHSDITTSTTVSNSDIGITVPAQNYRNFPTATAAATNTNSTAMPNLLMTSSAVPNSSTELIILNKSLDLGVTSPSEIVTPSDVALTSSLIAPITSSDISMTSGSAQHFPMSYDPSTASAILMTSPTDKITMPTATHPSSKAIANNEGDFTNTPISLTNSQPNSGSIT